VAAAGRELEAEVLLELAPDAAPVPAGEGDLLVLAPDAAPVPTGEADLLVLPVPGELVLAVVVDCGVTVEPSGGAGRV
jgi:hypothetical protein